jgi:hypothetical protein
MSVEDDYGRQPRAGAPRRPPRPDNDLRASTRLRPFLRQQRNFCPPCPKRYPSGLSPGRCGHKHQRGATLGSSDDELGGAGGRRGTDHVGARAPSLGKQRRVGVGGPPRGGSGSDRRGRYTGRRGPGPGRRRHRVDARGDLVNGRGRRAACADLRRREGLHVLRGRRRDQQGTAPARPAPSRPPSQLQDLRLRAPAAHAGDRPERHAGWRLDRKSEHPSTHAPALKRHPHYATRAYRGGNIRRDEVVELALETCHVWKHPRHQRRRSRGSFGHYKPGCYRPSAALKSASRLVTSQVNSLSERPKCP